MTICDKNKCTGCYACVNICPFGCISMQEDQYGELHPQIDEEKCKHCNKCRKICPNNNVLQFEFPIKCFASWITDQMERSICASGGIATMISKSVVKKGGVVFGTAYDKNFKPKFYGVDRLEDIERFKGSKYSQSIVGGRTFRQVKDFLCDGRLVLFIGTPCQVAGLKCFLQKDYANLVTIDLICHGVCPTRYFTEEISFLTKKYHLDNLSDIRFRGNDNKNYCLSLWRNKNGENSHEKELVYIKPRYEQPYFCGFILGVTLRENCYSCNYARPERVGDITVGDFLHLGKKIPFPYDVKQPSVVLLNNKKGGAFYEELSKENCGEIINIERNYYERLDYKPSLLEPFKRHPLQYKFRQLYLAYGFVKSIRAVLRFFIIKKKCRKIRKQWTRRVKKCFFYYML